MENAEPTMNPPQRRKHSIIFFVVLAAALYAGIQIYSLLSPIILSFLLIVLITLAVNPIIARMRIWTGGRKRSTGVVLAGVLALGGLTVWASVGPLKQASSTLSEKLPAYWERMQKPLIKMEQKGVISQEKLQKEVSEEIERETPENEETEEIPLVLPIVEPPPPPVESAPKQTNDEWSLRSSISGMIQSAFGQAQGLAHTTTEMLIVLLTVFFGVIFSLMNPRPIFGAMFSVVPECHHERMLVIMVRIARFVPRWAGSVLVSMLSIGSLFFLLMWPIFGLADALMLGLVASLLSAIPFVGPLLTLIPALLLAIGVGGMAPVWVVIAYSAVQALETYVITPLVMSHGIKLHPVALIFAMLLSIVTFGFLGVIIAAPLFAILIIIHEEIYRKRFLPTTTNEDLDRLARGALLDQRIR